MGRELDDQELKMRSSNSKENKKVFVFNQFTRWFVLVLSFLVVLYAVWVILYKLDSNSPKFFKIVPFIMIFLAANTILRNIFSLNKIVLRNKDVEFKYIGRKSQAVNYQEVMRISLAKAKLRAISIEFESNSDRNQIMILLSFPNILEIINNLALSCPNAEYDDFVQSTLYLDKDKVKDTS
jgi:hypothetical protein